MVGGGDRSIGVYECYEAVSPLSFSCMKLDVHAMKARARVFTDRSVRLMSVLCCVKTFTFGIHVHCSFNHNPSEPRNSPRKCHQCRKCRRYAMLCYAIPRPCFYRSEPVAPVEATASASVTTARSSETVITTSLPRAEWIISAFVPYILAWSLIGEVAVLAKVLRIRIAARRTCVVHLSLILSATSLHSLVSGHCTSARHRTFAHASTARRAADRRACTFRRTDFARCSCSCLLYTSPSPRDGLLSRMPSSA